MARQIHINNTFLDHIGAEQAWFLGLMASDGCVSDAGRASISQSGPHGEEMLKHCLRALGHTGALSHYLPRIGNEVHSLYLPSGRLVSRLADFGIVPRKTLTYQFPPTLPQSQIPNFIRGYLDGDGCVGVYKNGGSAQYLKIGLFGTPQFVRVLNEFVPLPGRTSLQRGGMQVWWNGANAVEFGKWVFSDTDLFKSKKYRIFWDAVPVQEAGRKGRWAILRVEVLSRLDAGESAMSVAKSLQIPFQTVYKIRANRV